MPQHILKVGPQDASLRLDLYLTKNLPDCPSRTFIKNLIETDAVRVNGKEVKAHHKVLSGDEIVIDFIASGDMEKLEPENIPLDIFYEDDSLIIVNKPAGMIVHPASGCRSGTLVNALLFHCRQLSDGSHEFRPGIVHRLDRDTSGVLLLAKKRQALLSLHQQMREGSIGKFYYAV